MNTHEVRDAVQRVRFDPTINMGHIISAGSFLAVGVALYVGIAVSIQDHDRRLTSLEAQDYPGLVLGAAKRDLRLEDVEKANDEQARVNSELLEKLTSLDRNVAVLTERLSNEATITPRR